MKIATIIVRVLLGLLYIAASVVVLFNLVQQPELAGKQKLFMDGMNATGYMLKLIKITELVCGLAFVSGRFVPLAAVIIAPVSLNILLYHVFVDTSGMPVGIFVVLANVFLGYAYRDKFAPLFEPK